MVIDAHQHFWKYDPVRDAWINDEMALLKRDLLPEDLKPVLTENGVDGCVVIQSDQSEAENYFQLANAADHDIIKGIVGWVDLQDKNIQEKLEQYSRYKKIKGFRHILQSEPQRDLMLRPNFLRGISFLEKYNYTYDILIFPDQLPYLNEFVPRFPGQYFVLDHLGKPNIKDRSLNTWKADIRSVAKHENLFCKISGMVTEANWYNWEKDDFYPYMDVVVESFGIDRLMFGSDWPVCMLAANYSQVVETVKNYFSMFSKAEQDKIWGDNAVRFYNLT